MAEHDQENIAPASRIPRPAGPSPALKSGIPTLSGLAVKRKAPSSPIPQPSKRVASGSNPSNLGQSTSRKASSGFLPTARKPVGSTGNGAVRAGSVPLGRSAASAGRPTSLASTASGGSSSSASRAKPLGIAAKKRPPMSASASSSAIRPAAGRPAPTRGVSPGHSGIGSGVASAAQVKSQNSRIDRLEQLMAQEQAKALNDQRIREAEQARHASNQSIEREARRNLANASEEIASLKAGHQREIEELEKKISRQDREKRELEEELRDSRDEISRERQNVRDLKQSMAEQSTQHMTLSAQLVASQTQLSILQAEVQRATISVSSMKAELEVGRQKARDAEDRSLDKVREAEEDRDRRISEIEEELRAAETIRRKLHNQVQELKGNIRVFARVRPALPHESESPDGVADIQYGDERKEAEMGQSEITLKCRSETAMGKEREQVHSFMFDKVFKPASGQKDVFEEISMLAQSVLDGYNVCIFAYGQTGSGKSWTMEGGDSEDTVGMIPRAIDMIFSASAHLKDRDWKYQMEGQFLEVYNEVINDLLGSGQFDSKKHEIKLDREGNMSVTDAVSIPLSNPRQVHTLLDRAKSRRAVAATLMNERSSRSHSVFTLKVRGVNPLTDERCEAMLNLVDLAGSERLTSSGADLNKDRLKETININKSLSALADVIGALGQGQAGGHVPYRNSTLTRLLQTSLSGSSKTLMMCNLSPLSAHLGETLCSLRFATKVNSTVVGAAKKQIAK